MLTLLAALGCSDPEPTLPEAELPVSEQPFAPDTSKLGPAIPMPWPAKPPCQAFKKVSIMGAYLQRADGTFLESSGEERIGKQSARLLNPADFGAGLSIRPDMDPQRITATCEDPREQVLWSCTARQGCTVEVQGIKVAPIMPALLADLDRASLAEKAPSKQQIQDLEPVVQAGVAYTISLLEACQGQGCASEEVIEVLNTWSGPLPTPTLLDKSPWLLIYKVDKEELHFSCRSSVCNLRTLGPIQTRLDLKANGESLYAIPGRLAYTQEREGPRVAFSGRLVPLADPPE